MQEKIRNPKTGRMIKKGGKTHLEMMKEPSSDLVEKVRNPETGRLIKKGGAIYKKLGAGVAMPLETVKVSKAFAPVRDVKIPKTIEKYPVDHSDVKWGLKKPQKVGERAFIKEECGESCFLMPEFNKFPICNKTLPCTYNCRGLKGASARAGEWKYKDVLQRSKKLTEEFGCYKKK